MMKLINRCRMKALLGAAVSVTALMSAAGAHAQQDETRVFNIPAQPLSSALMEYSRQSDIVVVVPSNLVRGLQSGSVEGALTPAAALERLVEGTDLRPERRQEGGLTLVRVDSAFPTRLGAAQEAPSEDEIIVTGTYIRGVENGTAPVVVIGREDIERSGYGTVQQVLESLPQNFGGGDNGSSEDGRAGLGQGRLTNFESASGVNLRGLGSFATLTLINGRRVAPAAYGGVVDISMIPSTAIERVEIITDGASSLYGSEAVAGVVNFILREDFEGAETRLRYGAATEGGMEERRFSQTFGARWNGGNGLFSYQRYERDALDASERTSFADAIGPYSLLPHRLQDSFMAALRQDITDRLEVSAEAWYNETSTASALSLEIVGPATAEFFSDSEQLNLRLGAAYALFSDWRIQADGGYSSQRSISDGDSTPPGMFGTLEFSNDFDLWSVDMIADGGLFDLPAGRARLAVGASYREEDFLNEIPSASLRRPVQRDVTALFGELFLPLVSPEQDVPFVRQLDLSMSARYDDYSDFGSTTNPKIGLLWRPVDDLAIRASAGTSFRAPYAYETLRSAVGRGVYTDEFDNPSGPGVVPALRLFGAATLRPEESESWTLGFTYRPSLIEGLEIGFNYYDIEYVDRIGAPTITSDALQRLDTFGPLVTTLANDAEAQAVIDEILASGGAYYDFTGTGPAGVRYVVDASFRNLSLFEQSGFDISADYSFSLGENRLTVSGAATFINEIETSYGAGAAAQDVVDVFGNPLDFRARASLNWSRGPWVGTVSLNYADAYSDQSGDPISSWTTTDFNLRYDLGATAGHTALEGVTLAISAINVFDEDPPYATSPGVDSGVYYDAANASPLGRFVAFEITKAW